jgi:transposase
LIEGIDAAVLLADRGYDTDSIIGLGSGLCVGHTSCDPTQEEPHSSARNDRDLYKLRHLVGNAFLYLKRWRGIATRYAKHSASFLAAIHIRCIAIWIDILS